MTWWMWVYIAIAIVIACCCMGFGIWAAKEEKNYSGRYETKDARLIVLLMGLGPLVIAPLWLPALLVGGLGYYTYTLRKVAQDAHIEELVPEWMERQAVYKKYKVLQAQNARLEKALEAKNDG